MLHVLPDVIARFFLGFSHVYFILSLLAVGYFFISRTVFYQATIVTLLAVISNVALKVTFQIPLSPTLHKVGFAFPSGHMQVSSVVYLWLFLSIQSTGVRIAIPCILTGIGYGLLHFQYHNFFDVLGGIVFALILISIYSIILSSKYYSKSHWLFVAYATSALGYIAYRYTIPTHALQAYCMLVTILLIKALSDGCQSKCFRVSRK